MNLNEFLNLPLWNAPFWEFLESIGAFAALISAIVTFIALIYAILQFREQKRVKEKSRIQELNDSIIIPLIKRLEVNIKDLKEKNIKYRRYEEGSSIDLMPLISFQNEEKLIFKDFADAYPEISQKMENCDKKRKELLEKANELAEKIKLMPEFRELFEKTWNGYTQIKKYPKECVLNWIINWIVNVREELERGHSYEEFWKKYSEQFLGLRNLPEIKKYVKELDEYENKLLKNYQELFIDLNKIRDKLTKNYGIKTKP